MSLRSTATIILFLAVLIGCRPAETSVAAPCDSSWSAPETLTGVKVEWVPADNTGSDLQSQVEVQVSQFRYRKCPVALMGIVANTGSIPLQSVELTAAAVDQRGTVITTETTYVLEFVRPGDRVPFYVSRDDLDDLSGAGWKSTDLRIRASLVVTPDDISRLAVWSAYSFVMLDSQLATTNIVGRRAPSFMVSGHVRNASTRRANVPRAIAAAFDAQGQMVGAGDGFVASRQLAPGEVGDFVLWIFESIAPIDHYEVQFFQFGVDDEGSTRR